MWKYLITQDVYELCDLLGVLLVPAGINPEIGEERAKEIADTVEMNPSKIQAAVIESIEVEEINESIFDFDDDADYHFDEDTDDDVNVAKMLNDLKLNQAEKAPRK